MTHDPTTDSFTASSHWRALYREQVDALDPATRNELRLRRRAALANSEARSLAPRWWPAGGAVAAAALALMVWLPTSTPPPPRGLDLGNAEGLAVTPARLAMGEASLATLELDNDSDFYLWLAYAPAETDTPSHSNEATL